LPNGEVWRFAGVPTLVAGAGVTGTAVARVLVRLGARVTVTDTDANRLAVLADLPVRRETGLTEPPEDTEIVVTSPGWRPSTPLLAAAARRGIEVIGDVELAWRMGAVPSPVHGYGPAPVWLAVTGTNGKTTAVGMLESILLAAGEDAAACGNIGLPVVEALEEGFDTLAVELSSFQLHWSSCLRPLAAAVLNVSEDHLDWHGGIEQYAAAKGRIYQGASHVVFNADDPVSTRLAAEHRRRIGFTLGDPEIGQVGVSDGMILDRAFAGGRAVMAASEVVPAGPHNVANALAAAALALAHDVEHEDVATGLRNYEPGAHRAVPVAEVDGVSYVDDSKATNPHAAAASLRAHRRVVWIAGGLLKGASVDDLVCEARDRLAGAVLLGADADTIADGLARHAPEVPVIRVAPGEDGPMTVAVEQARMLASPGDVVLLAPAAASMDMFENYARRGDAFVEAVRSLGGPR
jgi:UDP-N-acetylmuramoylalanine--D-glutamate ligase